jgi:hypothetical protein
MPDTACKLMRAGNGVLGFGDGWEQRRAGNEHHHRDASCEHCAGLCGRCEGIGGRGGVDFLSGPAWRGCAGCTGEDRRIAWVGGRHVSSNMQLCLGLQADGQVRSRESLGCGDGINHALDSGRAFGHLFRDVAKFPRRNKSRQIHHAINGLHMHSSAELGVLIQLTLYLGSDLLIAGASQPTFLCHTSDQRPSNNRYADRG